MGLGSESFLYLTTRGRRTGRPRQIEIWFVAHAGCFYLVAELGEGAGWVQNLRAHERVEFSIGTREARERDVVLTHADARAIDDGDETDLCGQIRALMNNKYGWSDGLIVEIEPDA